MVIGWRDVCQQEPVICPCGNWSMRAQIEKDIQDHAATLVADYAFDQLMPSHSSSFYVAESAFIFAF